MKTYSDLLLVMILGVQLVKGYQCERSRGIISLGRQVGDQDSYVLLELGQVLHNVALIEGEAGFIVLLGRNAQEELCL